MTLLERFDQALAEPVGALSVHDVRRQMHMVRSIQAVAASRLVDLHRRMAELSTSQELGVSVDPERELRNHGGLRSRDVRAVECQTSAVDAVPELGRLWSAGVTSTAHVEAVGRVLSSVGEGRDALLDQAPQIVERAAVMKVDDFDRYVRRLARDAQPDDGLERFERQRRLTHLRVWNDVDGMVNLAGCFDPERGAAVLGALERRVETMFHSGDREQPVDVAPGIQPNDHRRALAFVSLCAGSTPGVSGTGAAATGANGELDGGPVVDCRPARAEVVVHIDLATLKAGLSSTSVCRTSHGADLPPATVRRLACDADIVPLVLDERSVPLDVGRSRRLATVHQRRALEAVHPTCAMPDCTVAYLHCTIHHIVPWEHGGPTDLDNLVPLCSRHHHAVHEGGWRIRLETSTRRLAVTLPGPEPVTSARQRSAAEVRSPFS